MEDLQFDALFAGNVATCQPACLEHRALFEAIPLVGFEAQTTFPNRDRGNFASASTKAVQAYSQAQDLISDSETEVMDCGVRKANTTTYKKIP